MTTLWKQAQTLHPTFERFHRCLEDDWFLLDHEITLQRAHAAALLDAGILTAAETQAIGLALDEIQATHTTPHAPPTPPASDAEDLHTWIEAELTARTGDAGRKIHTARSRNDQVATLLSMHAIASAERLAKQLGGLVETLCRRSIEWSDLQLPLQTHAQFAAPGSTGAWSMRYATALDRVREQLVHHAQRWRRSCALGSGAVAGSSIAIDRKIQAAHLGFDGPSLNALDATTTRDECLELLAVGTQLALHLQSLATDGIAFSQTPFAWIAYPAPFATGSSMMPNKSNPDALELLRGEANSVSAAHAHVVLLLKGLPSGYNRDLQCIKPIVRDAADTLLGLIDLAGAFVGSVAFDADRLDEALAHGDVQATLRMEMRVQSGQPLRTAHHAETGVAVELDPSLNAERYRTTGSASPAEVRRTANILLTRLGAEPIA